MNDDSHPEMPKKNSGTDRLPFGRILSALMRERDLTLKEIASMAGVKPSVAQDWAAGANPHDLVAVHRLAQKLGVNFQALLLGVQEESKASTIAELYEEVPLLDGLCTISIKKLVKRKETE